MDAIRREQRELIEESKRYQRSVLDEQRRDKQRVKDEQHKLKKIIKRDIQLVNSDSHLCKSSPYTIIDTNIEIPDWTTPVIGLMVLLYFFV